MGAQVEVFEFLSLLGDVKGLPVPHCRRRVLHD